MGKLFWGAAFIVTGTLFLLQSAGVLQAGFAFWPLVSLIVGVYLVIRGFVSGLFSLREKSSWMKLAFGIWIGSWGLFETLHANGFVSVNGWEAVVRAWPVLLVALGLALVTGDLKIWFVAGPVEKRFGRQEVDRELRETQREMGRLGDIHLGRKPWRLDGGLDVNHSIGDVRVDLTTAEITPGEHPIQINSSIGEVVVLVPADCSVKASAFTTLGSIRLFDEEREGATVRFEKSVVVPDSDVTLDIKIHMRIGSVRVRRVSASGEGEEKTG